MAPVGLAEAQRLTQSGFSGSQECPGLYQHLVETDNPASSQGHYKVIIKFLYLIS